MLTSPVGWSPSPTSPRARRPIAAIRRLVALAAETRAPSQRNIHGDDVERIQELFQRLALVVTYSGIELGDRDHRHVERALQRLEKLDRLLAAAKVLDDDVRLDKEAPSAPARPRAPLPAQQRDEFPGREDARLTVMAELEEVALIAGHQELRVRDLGQAQEIVVVGIGRHLRC